MAAPYNPPIKGQDYLFRVPLRAIPRAAGFVTSPSIKVGDFRVDKDGVGLVNLTTTPVFTYVANTVLMLHAEGVDGSTSIVDSSPSLHPVTVVGNTQVDTSQHKYGSSAFLFDSTGDYLSLDGSSDFAFGTGDFTVDLWIRWPATPTTHTIFNFSSAPGTAGDPSPWLYCFSNQLYYNCNGNNMIIGSAAKFAANRWYHIAVARNSGNTRMFVDGVQDGSTYTNSSSFGISANLPTVSSSGSINGWVDDFRVIKGTGLWTANFTPSQGYNNLINLYLSATEMNADVVTIVGQDQSVPKQWEDFVYTIHTVA